MRAANRSLLIVGAQLATAMVLELLDKGYDVIEATPEEVENSRRASEYPIVKFSDGMDESRLIRAVPQATQPWYHRDRRGRPSRY